MLEKRLLRFVRSIEEATVYDPLSVRIGTIERLLIDPVTWRARVLLVSFDIPGVSGEPLPLPWRVIQYNAYADRFFTLVTKTQLSHAPRYNEAAAEAADWEEHLHRYYNVTYTE